MRSDTEETGSTLMKDEEPQRRIEASLAQALTWGPDVDPQEGPPPTPTRQAGRTSSMIRRFRIWIARRGPE
jgi:hypothetical protein